MSGITKPAKALADKGRKTSKTLPAFVQTVAVN
jgi:hypothetical protein